VVVAVHRHATRRAGNLELENAGGNRAGILVFGPQAFYFDLHTLVFFYQERS
jgi:hypothetical protein